MLQQTPQGNIINQSEHASNDSGPTMQNVSHFIYRNLFLHHYAQLSIVHTSPQK